MIFQISYWLHNTLLQKVHFVSALINSAGLLRPIAVFLDLQLMLVGSVP